MALRHRCRAVTSSDVMACPSWHQPDFVNRDSRLLSSSPYLKESLILAFLAIRILWPREPVPGRYQSIVCSLADTETPDGGKSPPPESLTGCRRDKRR